MKKYDLIVVGGGFAGVAAAISAAREHLRVLLVEKGNALGGAAANNLVMPFMRFKMTKDEKVTELCSGIFKEIGSKLSALDKFKTKGNDTFFDDEYLKLCLNRMVLEAGVELLYHGYITKVNKEGNRIKSVIVAGKAEDIEIYADYFVDATGDANLAALAGCPFRVGREKDNLCQPMTLCFRLANVDVENMSRADINRKYKEFKAESKIKNPREDVLIFETLADGVLHFNTTRIIKMNPCNIFDITKAEIESREQMYEIFNFLKENFECFKNASIVNSASEIGVRESRMIDGEYILTANDLLEHTRFEDTIALGNYEIDIHNPEGEGTTHHYFKRDEYYNIPYRCLIPQKLVTGKYQ